ncbi:MAG: hypothetical protein A2508_08680 [Candidatus Lambdaproteobacteria bacterium RIFOXYD12_FULL_49_8]|uniref:Diguanylate cyclase n=1 Tax=Candidatus Lambdaproteobacteria bacterium RIFOXYD2_FULL_50_16 TaxID=1817772 RepID=A0A1F6GAF5_9PROT|nr:MAG: hypothetical protein A2527_07875 [Candidatus Lambdaproteobacteria bacterium RIFOXYD2_FULL_50_16]OGG98009.1 MAG: hypothetical protein A2508_08680 [Candidatus Lambdaproteobacteria bacterium RIFOXYD12_FULL_49_8]
MDLKKATILDAIGEGLFVVDLEGRIRFWNRWISTYTKQEPKAVIGKRLDEVFPEVNQDQLVRKIGASLRMGVPTYFFNLASGWFIKIPFKKVTGSPFEYMQQQVTIHPLDPKEGLVVLLLQDQTAAREAQHRLSRFEASEAEQKKLFLDQLTGLHSRSKMLQDLPRASKPLLAIFSVDLFNEMNKFYGYETGELILKEVSARLKSYFGDEALGIYKLPSAEFAVLEEGSTSIDKWTQKVQYFLENTMTERLDNPKSGQRIPLSMTAGISRDKKQLLRHADLALKAAIERKKTWLIFDKSLDDLARFEDNIRWVGIVREALEDGRIIPYYQPIIDNKSGETTKYETLVRLIDPQGKVISPYYFLEVAKKAKLYAKITQRVLDCSFETFADSKAEFSVNLTVDDIQDKETLEYIYRKLLENPKMTHRVIFEIIESEGIENFEEVSHFIQRVKSLGGKIAIDDFGTGYSNFEYLVRLDVDIIKIDGSLIRNLDFDKNKYMVVETLVEFAKKLGLQTVAEFVDSNNVLNAVKALGITYSQGFFLGQPEALIEKKGSSRVARRSLNENQLDAFKELMNIAFGSALSVMADIVGSLVSITVPNIDVMDPDKLNRFVDLSLNVRGESWVGSQTFSGMIEGEVLLFIAPEPARNLAALFENKQGNLLSEKTIRGAVLDFVNIIATACVKNFSEHLDLHTKLNFPALEESRIGLFKAELGLEERLVMVDTVIKFQKRDIHANLVLLTRVGDSLLTRLDQYIEEMVGK